MISVIKTSSDYHVALESLKKLIDLDPEEGSREANELEILSLLINDYENKNYQMPPPDPIAAILFRMDQLGLSRRDLEPYIGSRSKVSEVLSRKQQLSLSMIKSLHSGLQIPAEILLQEIDDIPTEDAPVDWSVFPIAEMHKRSWISSDDLTESTVISELESLLQPFGGFQTALAHFRKTQYVRSARTTDKYALLAWVARVWQKANSGESTSRPYLNDLNLDTMQEIARISRFEDGPQRVIDALRAIGIRVVIERHLPRTYLDGAAILILPDQPIIGLSLRHDRINNFWFTIMHELAHIALHVNSDISDFIDDLDLPYSDNDYEQEADSLADEALIPATEWAISPARHLNSPEAAEHLASKLQIHRAIVAGKMQFAAKSYRILNNLVGRGAVRCQFQDTGWD